MKLCFAGLGIMGGPMAGHLVRAGHEVTGYNRSHAKATAWAAEHGAKAADTIEAAVADADALLLCVGRDDDVRDLLTWALPHIKSGALVFIA